MRKHHRFTLLTTALLIALIFSSMQPVLVRADDTLPPPPATEVVDPAAGGEPVQPPVEEPVVQEPAATEAPVVTEEPPVIEESIVPEPIATEAPVSDTAETEEALSLPEVLEQLPDETMVVVLDEGGEALPLATQVAANVLVSSDPMWCPEGQTPGGAGCTLAFATVTELIAVLGSYSGAGTIYFTPTYSTNDATFDHTHSNLINLTDLTIQGGWNGLTGAGYALSGASTFSGSLTITNWTGNVTLNDLIVGGNGNFIGVNVATSGDIELNNVEANNNAISILFATMGTGANLDAGGDIRVRSSTFNNNGGMGLNAISDGNITLTDVVISNNIGNFFGMPIGQGAYLDAGGDISVENSAFNNNVGTGLSANSYNGSILLNGVEANDNLASLDFFMETTIPGHGASLYASSNINVMGSTFNNNAGYGVEAYAVGNISLSNVAADNNSFIGAILQNCGACGTGSILVEASQFNNNGWEALEEEESGDGLVALSNAEIRLIGVIANGNYASGAYLDNMWEGSTGNILVMSSQFSENGLVDGWDGITTFSNGDVTVQCSDFENNGDYGVFASMSGGTLTLTGNTFINNVSGDTFLEDGTLVDDPDYICNPVLSTSPARSKKDNATTSNGLPINVIHVNGGEQTALSCNGFSGTELVLPNGDRIVLPCPNGDQASLAPLTSAQLPGALDGNFTLISGLDADVEPSLLGQMIVKFIIPDDQQNADFTVLHWDGEKWEDLGGYKASDSFFRVDTQSMGTFVFVRK